MAHLRDPRTSRRLAELACELPAAAAYRAAALAAPAIMPAKARRLYEATRRLFPERSAVWAARTARRQLAHRAWVAVDKLKLARMSGDDLVDAVEPETVDHVRSVLGELAGEGRGALLYSLHYGRPVVATYLLPRLGFECVAIRRGLGAALGAGTLDAGALSGLLTAIRELRRGKVLFVLVDGRLARSASPVELFGRSVPMSLAFLRMARETGAGLVAAAASSVGPFRFRIDLERTPDPGRNLSPAAAAGPLLRPLERLVRRDVGQWYGINRMFRDVERSGAPAREIEARLAAAHLER
jgi:lauroyl/myristoyl acyltransferase